MEIVIGIAIIVVFLFLCSLTLCMAGAREDKLREKLLHNDSKYNQEKAENESHILSDNLTELEKESVNKLIKELDILLFEKNNNADVTVGECLDNAENGRYAILQAGKVIGFTI